jgi:hypothetical protein
MKDNLWCQYSDLPSVLLYEKTNHNGLKALIATERIGFMKGAKWQQERMYSEEEVLDIVQECKKYLAFGDEFDEIKWFNQFKKKMTLK